MAPHARLLRRAPAVAHPLNANRRMLRTRRQLWMAALLLALFAGGSAPPCAAQAVTSTSGSPAAIARIRQEFAAVEREAHTYRRTTHEVLNFSIEGGELTGFFRGRELRKLHARLFGETWRGTEEYYFAGGQLIFIHVVHERYAEPFGEGGQIAARIEHRLYFDGGRLIRRLRTQSPRAEDLSMFDPEVPTLRRNAQLFAACAASADPQAPQCTAPEP